MTNDRLITDSLQELISGMIAEKEQAVAEWQVKCEKLEAELSKLKEDKCSCPQGSLCSDFFDKETETCKYGKV